MRAENCKSEDERMENTIVVYLSLISCVFLLGLAICMKMLE